MMLDALKESLTNGTKLIDTSQKFKRGMRRKTNKTKQNTWCPLVDRRSVRLLEEMRLRFIVRLGEEYFSWWYVQHNAAIWH